MLSIATPGRHIFEHVSIGTFPDTFNDDIHGVVIQFTAIIKTRCLTVQEMERIVNAALSAADAEAELIDRGQ